MENENIKSNSDSDEKIKPVIVISPASYTHEEALKFLKEKGMALTDIVKVRNLFANWGRASNPNVMINFENGGDIEYYTHKMIEGLRFETKKQAELAYTLIAYNPDASKDKIMNTVFPIVLRLIEAEKSALSFTPG